MKTIGQILGQTTRTMEYRELLQTPEWKAYAKRQYERFSYTCAACKLGDRVLNVHHFAYSISRLPWEYEDHEVTVICQNCHMQMHVALTDFRKYVFGRLTPRAFEVLNGALAVGFREHGELEFCHAVASLASSRKEFVKNFALDGANISKG